MFQISEQLLQAIAGYLATKPYKEVAVYLSELNKLQKVVEVKKPEVKKEEVKK